MVSGTGGRLFRGYGDGHRQKRYVLIFQCFEYVLRGEAALLRTRRMAGIMLKPYFPVRHRTFI